MLIIRRRVGERIVIGSNIEVTVASASKRVVRLAIAAPRGIQVLRGEVHDTVVAANRAATHTIIELETPEGDEAPDSEVVVTATIRESEDIEQPREVASEEGDVAAGAESRPSQAPMSVNAQQELRT